MKELLIKIIKRKAGKQYQCDAKSCDHTIEPGEKYYRLTSRESMNGGSKSTTKTFCHRHTVNPSVRVKDRG